MAGFLSSLFGRGSEPKSSEAFFLSEDDAKTFGDIDYMRSSKVVKRTFARKKGQLEELESVRQISAMDKREVNEERRTKPKSTVTSSSNTSSTQSTFQQNSSSSNDMDMFRSMAKNIRKR